MSHDTSSLVASLYPVGVAPSSLACVVLQHSASYLYDRGRLRFLPILEVVGAKLP